MLVLAWIVQMLDDFEYHPTRSRHNPKETKPENQQEKKKR